MAIAQNRYTFGDNHEASARLRRLAELYAPETRDLLLRGGARRPRLAIDLGCGPGWTTRLLHDALQPVRNIGLDASARYVEEARRNAVQRSLSAGQYSGQHGSPALEFYVHDVTRTPFPVGAPDTLLCRFLLTHLRQPGEVLAQWATASAPDSLLFIHETESMDAEHPALRRYYELVAQLQRHYGQTLEIGPLLEECVAKSGWHVVESVSLELRKPANAMAQLHVANLRSWRQDVYAQRAFDSAEIDALEKSLTDIADGATDDRSPTGSVVVNAARQIIARRDASK